MKRTLIALSALALSVAAIGTAGAQQLPRQEKNPNMEVGEGGFRKLDRDNDNAISREEAKAHPRIDQHFAGMDTNGDGKVTAEEARAFRHGNRDTARERVDANGDGKATKDEAQAYRDRARSTKFEKADKNGDGAVTRDELAGHSGALARFDQTDTNKDGKLTKDEIDAAKAMR